MMLALTAPDRVRRVMVADIAPAPTQQGHRHMIERLDAITFPPNLTRNGVLDLLEPITGSRAVAELMAQNVGLDDTPGWAIGFDGITQSIDLIEGWPDIQAPPYDGPALFLRGGTSEYVRPEHHPLIQALFPEARIRTLEGAGHWLHAEQPRPFMAEMMAFLNDQPV